MWLVNEVVKFFSGWTVMNWLAVLVIFTLAILGFCLIRLRDFYLGDN